MLDFYVDTIYKNEKEHKMKYTLGEKKNGVIEVKFALNAKEWEEEVAKAYENHKKEYKKEGFRNGKVPRKVLEQMYGENLFYEDAFNDSFPVFYTKMLEKEKQIYPVDYPAISVEKMDNSGLEFTAKITLLPEVTLGEYQGIEIKKKSDKVTEAEIKKELETLAEKQVKFVEVENREAKMGDLVNIDYAGFDGETQFEGGTAKDQELELGSNTFIPGFEDQVAGMKIGEEKDVNVTFPEHYHADNLAGKPVVFKVKLLAIREKVLPEINDEFASNTSEFETLADLKKSIKERLQENKTKEVEADAENRLVEAIVKNASVDVPSAMVDSQIDHELHHMEEAVKMYGLDLESYMQIMGTTLEQYRKAKAKEAEVQVKTSLVLEEIIKKESIKVLAKDIKAKIAEIAENTKRNVSDVEREMQERESYLKNTILSEKVINRLKELNNIK